MSRRRQLVPETSASFLDVICCGFGAIVLLLILVRSSPAVPQQDLRQLQDELFAMRGHARALAVQSDEEQAELVRLRSRLRSLVQSLASIQAQQEQKRDDMNLYQALQSLTAEMRALQQRAQGQRSDHIGGVPVDSEYIAFIIDTSGSMVSAAWPRLLAEVENILRIHPRVLGIQVMNDMGQYLFPTYDGQWIPDTPGRRRVILNGLRNWNSFSNSSPVEGIRAAIDDFYDPGRRISLYVMGDDYSGRSLQSVLDLIAAINHKNADGKSMVRIHTIGFPVHFVVSGAGRQASRYAALMRALAEQNNGSFIGLNGVR